VKRAWNWEWLRREGTSQGQGRRWWMGVKHREAGNGNKTGTFLRNGGEGLGRRDSFLLHALEGPAGSALH